MDIRQVLGKNIRRIRTQAGLSQETVAERIGADRAYVSSMERGLQNITLFSLWHVAEALGVRPVDLLNEHTVDASDTDDREAPASS